MLFYFLQGAALALPSVFTPSAFKMFLISEALRNGFRRAIPIAFTPLITDGPIIILVVFILTNLPPFILDLLRLAGGLFLLYLTTRLLNGLRYNLPTLMASPFAARQTLGRSIIINLLNPNPYFLWGIVAGPILIVGLRESWPVGLSFVVGFYGLFVGGLIGLAALFATVGRMDPRINRIMTAVSALAMGAIGLYQIVVASRALFGFS